MYYYLVIGYHGDKEVYCGVFGGVNTAEKFARQWWLDNNEGSELPQMVRKEEFSQWYYPGENSVYIDQIVEGYNFC